MPTWHGCSAGAWPTCPCSASTVSTTRKGCQAGCALSDACSNCIRPHQASHADADRTADAEEVEAYTDIRQELEGLSGSINGEFGDFDWTPVRYIHRAIPRATLTALSAQARPVS